MVDTADVVVVGGGILGTSLALHLLEGGAGDVRLLERDGLFQGTTAAGAGFLSPWSALSPFHGGTSKMLPIERYGMRFYADLHAAGYDIDYRNNGVLWVIASEESWSQNKDLPWQAADPDGVRVDAAKITELTGGAVIGDQVKGAQYLPSGAQVTTVKVGVALADRIAKLGGTIDTRRPVTGLRLRGGRVVGVDTPSGPVECDTVVVAAGVWSSALLKQVDFVLPAFPQVTSRIITEPIGISETMPSLMLLGSLPGEPGGGPILWARWHDGGLLWGGVYTTEPRNILVDAPVPERLDDLPNDGVLEDQRAARAATYFPKLSHHGGLRIKHGAPCYTSDEMALVGPVPGVEGLYALGGDNEMGITQGPGYGKALADQIVHGSSDLVDLRDWRLDRFGAGFADQTQVMNALGAAFEQLFAGAPEAGAA
jgi:glycine/D-amino acid oxidase-like deaminating enzyme